MKILAIDPATITGWAYSNGTCGIWDLRIKNDESSGMRLIRFEGKLNSIQSAVGVDLIVFESITAGAGPKANFTAIKLQTKLQAIIERWCEKNGIEHVGYNLMSVKKHAIPQKGVKRDKAAMVGAAKKRWPDKDIEDDNVADALWILDLATEEYGGVEGVSLDDSDQRFERGCE